jgi:two-component system response regulator DctR
MTSWRVLIVEDDLTVARLHRRIVERVPRFAVVGIVGSGEAALHAIGAVRPHLLLLDLGLRGSDGIELLRRVRFAREPVEAIAVTAARSAETVRQVVHLGALDYLVKPFNPARLEQALAAFVQRQRGYAGAALDQAAVDAVCASGRPARRWLPKGIAPSTLEQVRASVAAAGVPVNAEQVAASVPIARVTARRYLDYLEATRELMSETRSGGPGRPRRWWWAPVHDGARPERDGRADVG